MKRIAAPLCLLLVIASAGLAQTANLLADPGRSPAEQNIAQARKLIEKNSSDFEAYNSLASALSRRARETSTIDFYDQAAQALQKSFSIAPENFNGQKIQVCVLLGKHDFAAALEIATKLNRKMPDDLVVYGLLTDANVGLGNYHDAETAAQWMLDLRAGNLATLTRVAQLRELFGDSDGAFELFDLAYQSTAPSEIEERARVLTQMGHLRFASGSISEAEKLLQRALTAFPGYAPTLTVLAEIRIAQKNYPEAVALLQQRYRPTSHAADLYDLAEALQLAGRNDESKKTFSEFETKALVESDQKDNSNHELVFYYADQKQQTSKALEVARREYSWRRDVYTLDAYAWALHVNGQDAEARRQIETALAVGIHDAKLFLHAGKIALTLGDIRTAEGYLKQSAELNTGDSEQARSLLADLGPRPAQQ